VLGEVAQQPIRREPAALDLGRRLRRRRGRQQFRHPGAHAVPAVVQQQLPAALEGRGRRRRAFTEDRLGTPAEALAAVVDVERLRAAG